MTTLRPCLPLWRRTAMRNHVGYPNNKAAQRWQSTSAMDTAVEYLQNDLQAAAIELSDNLYMREAHGKGESFHPIKPPALVAFPTSTEQVQDIVRKCVQYRIPIVPFGGGTSVEGQLPAHVPHSLSLDLTAMNQILHLPEMDAASMDMPPDPYVIVQAGVTRQQLEQALRATGYQFTVDPGAATATLGGMVATGAAGTTTIRYGAMRDNLLGLQAVLANDQATVVRTGCTTRKNSAGYDLTSLLCGSEGTLAVITQATLRVWPVPACVVAGRAAFVSLAAAARAVAALTSVGVDLVRCEILDAASVKAFNTYNQQQNGATQDLELVPTLFFELQGASESILQQQVDLVSEVLQDDKTADTQWAWEAGARQALWKARHSLYYAAIASRPKATNAIVTDACVNLSHLPALLEATAADVQAAGLVGPCFGHAGDGSFHCILPVSEEDTEDYWQRVHKVNDNLLQRTLAVGGTVTGEHGVGTGKIKYLEQQYGPGAVQMMRLIKSSLDPHGLLNPGKVLEDERVQY